MSLIGCLISSGKNLSAAEKEELRAVAAKNRETMEQKPAEIAAVQAALDSAIADRAEIEDLIREAGGEQVAKKQARRVKKAKPVEAAKPVEVEQPAEDTGPITDIGEKIGGARKDMAESGGTRSKKASTDDRPAWARRFQVSQIVSPGGMIGEVKDAGRWIVRDTRNLDWMKQAKQVGRETYATKEEAEAIVTIAAVSLKHRVVLASRAAPKSEAEVDAMLKADMAAKEADTNRPGKIEYGVMESARKRLAAGTISQADFDKVESRYGYKASQYTPPAAQAALAPTGDKYEIWRDITDRKRVKVVDKQFDSRDEAMKYMLVNAVQIVEANTTFGEADLPLPPDRKRTGPERRTGNVKGDDFKTTFGFRGVEFGNWNNQDERQTLMNDAWDGLLDLADVLGVPPKALGMNGDLALAFGARGHGLNSARAHYEPSRAVINLTKEHGAGSLAHEWFHGLDHYFGRQDGKASATWKIEPDGTRTLAVDGGGAEMVSTGFRGERSGVRKELRDAYEAMLRTMTKKAETYVEDTAKADKFVGVARESLASELASLRRELAEQKDVRYYKRNNAPASAELLAEFDAIAKRMLDGELDALATDWKTFLKGGDKPATSRGASIATRWTNDSLERMSAIHKAVRGRSGFDGTNKNGVLDRLRGSMERYSQRLKMLADAQAETGKVRAVPTDFAMNARELDQGRGTDYWTTPHEMAARAFQGYVEDKIAESGGVSRFLNYAPENAVILTPWGFKRPYPAGQERKAINAALDKFVAELKTREDDAGNVAMFSRAPQTNTEAFKKWFGASKVVDAEGEPLVVYHGTDKAFSEFSDSMIGTRADADANLGDLGDGFYFTPDPGLASAFAVGSVDNQRAGASGANVVPVYLSIKNPISSDELMGVEGVDAMLQDPYPGDSLRALLEANGYDGIISEDTGEIVAFHPEQIKSAIGNVGTFDPANPDIRYKRPMAEIADATDYTSAEHLAHVERTANAIAEQWENPPQIIVARDMQDPQVPESVRRNDAEQRRRGAKGTPLGFYLGGRVYLIASELQNHRDIVETVFHEALGHAGLRAAYGPALIPILKKMARLNPQAVQAKAIAYGLGRMVDGAFQFNNDFAQVQAAEEVLAELAQTRPTSTWVKQAIAAIRSWLRENIPGFKDMTYSDAELIRNFIAPARNAIERGAKDAGDMGSGASMFSRSNGDTRTLAAQDLTAKPEVSTDGVFKATQRSMDNLKEKSRPLWLALLTRDQLADIYSNEIPPVKDYDDLTRAMENERSKIAQDADDLYNKWAKLTSEANDKVSRIMLDATVYGVHPDKFFNPTPVADRTDSRAVAQAKANDNERRKVHARLKAEWDALPADAKAIYTDARKFHLRTLTKLRDALEARIIRQVEAGNARAAALTALRATFDSYLREGPYFPLSRFGDFLVIGTRDDGERVVASYASPKEQKAAAKELQVDGFKVKMTAASKYSRSLDGDAGKFIGSVLTTLDKLDMDEAALTGEIGAMKAKLLDDVNQLFIKALPDLSYRKHFIHRKNVPGFSADMMRGFANSAFHAAGHIARVNYGDRMTSTLREAMDAIKQAPEGDFSLHQQVLDELAKRHDVMLNPNTSPAAALLNQAGFLFFLGLSPAAGLVNTLQTPMVTMPYLGARYGFDGANQELAKAYWDITTGARFNAQSGWNAIDSKKLSAAEVKMMRQLHDEGVIDLTQAHDLASATGLDTGNVAKSKAAFATARAMKIVAWTFHVPEVMNRQVSALTAYRLEMEKSGDVDKAIEMARETIKRTHYDYSASNRARFMQGNVARVAFQFKQYAQQTIYLLARSAYLGMKGETPEVRRIAKRQLVATLGMTWLAAGTLGLPGVGAIAALAGLVISAFDDDDEPFDWDVEFRNFAADAGEYIIGAMFGEDAGKKYGKKAGEVLSRGAARLTPWDISHRVGMESLWFRSDDQEGQSPKEAFATDLINNVLGPNASTLLGFYRGADLIRRGQHMKAIEAMVPKFLRDPIKAYREGTEGVTTSGGEPVMELTPAEIGGQALGFNPARKSEVYEGRAAVKNTETLLMEKASVLRTQAAMARIEKDEKRRAELEQEIAEFNARNPGFKITKPSIVQAVINKRRNRAKTEDGILLPKKHEELRERGRFAVTE